MDDEQRAALTNQVVGAQSRGRGLITNGGITCSRSAGEETKKEHYEIW